MQLLSVATVQNETCERTGYPPNYTLSLFTLSRWQQKRNTEHKLEFTFPGNILMNSTCQGLLKSYSLICCDEPRGMEFAVSIHKAQRDDR